MCFFKTIYDKNKLQSHFALYTETLINEMDKLNMLQVDIKQFVVCQYLIYFVVSIAPWSLASQKFTICLDAFSHPCKKFRLQKLKKGPREPGHHFNNTKRKCF